MKKRYLLLGLAAAAIGFSGVSHAAGDAKTPPNYHWTFSGMFGHYDQAALQRGFKVYRNVCAGCHGLKLLSYRNLTDLGYNEAQVKNIAAEYTVVDGPDDEGEMFERPARPSDRFVYPYANEAQARAANNGAYPVDFSLIAKARPHGPDYIRALLLGYTEPPEGVTLQPGQYWNKYKAGHVIAMAAPLSDGIVPYEDGSPETKEQYASDITHFLMWAADPHLETRKQAGFATLIFLIVFAGIMYAVKKRLWKDVK